MLTLSFVIVAVSLVAVLNILILRFLYSRKNSNETDVLHTRLDSVTKLILDELQENRKSVQSSSMAVHQQVQQFTSGLTQLQENVKNVHESLHEVVSFQNYFRSPKLRGQWGETSLEAALANYFPKELYSIQHYFKNGEAVDAVLRLPNNLLLPIDSKFNWENFEKMIHAENDISKEAHQKQFLSDVKKKIDEIAGKYILPSEGTTEVALMYIPAETVYYELIHNIKEANIPDYAAKKRVVLISPNTLFVTLSSIHHWFRDVHITRQTQEIIRRLSVIKKDAEKLGDGFRRLGKHIADAHSAYDDSEKRLTLLTDRVGTIIDVGEVQETNSKETEIVAAKP